MSERSSMPRQGQNPKDPFPEAQVHGAREKIEVFGSKAPSAQRLEELQEPPSPSWHSFMEAVRRHP